jgi:hypothetical protein
MGLTVSKCDDYPAFWDILTENLLAQHNLKPVHTLNEILLLKSRFPNHIKLFGAFKDGRMVAGNVFYESSNVAHSQYTAANGIGKECGGLDILFDFLLKDYYKDKLYFDFGVSTESNGAYLNTGLVEQKEGFGARTIVHDHYAIDIT